MKAEGLCFLCTKQLLKGKSDRRPRHFFTIEDFDIQRALADVFKEKRGEDFLIAKVVFDIHTSPVDPIDRTGKYILINKHQLGARGLKRRAFFPIEHLEKYIELGRTFSTQKGDDFLIVQVVEERSASEASKKRARLAWVNK